MGPELLSFFKDLQKSGLDYAVVGGYAVALHGAVRGTVDLDIALEAKPQAWRKFTELLGTRGFESRLPLVADEVFRFRDEYAQKRNLIAWSFYHRAKPYLVVDLLLTEDAARINKISVRLGEVSIQVASLEALIEMKTRSGRPQDLLDVEALEQIRLDRVQKPRTKK